MDENYIRRKKSLFSKYSDTRERSFKLVHFTCASKTLAAANSIPQKARLNSKQPLPFHFPPKQNEKQPSDFFLIKRSFYTHYHFLPGPIVGHVGDGNFHMFIPVDTENKEEVKKVKEFSQLLGRYSSVSFNSVSHYCEPLI